MLCVKINRVLASEYEAREVYPFITVPGWYEVTKDQFECLYSDAKYQIDPIMELEHEPRIKRAYRALIKQIDGI